MAEWFETWFDEDYARLYAHRDAEEARVALGRAMRVAPELAQGPVLDLACGAGRHLEILRRANPMAFGMDLSRPLLQMAPGGLRPWLLRGDMRRIPVKDGSLHGICLWFTPFGYFDDEENRALMMRLGALLENNGVLVMDYLNADLVARTLVPEETVERGIIRAQSRRSLEGDRLVKRMVLTRTDTGEVRDVLESVRLYHPTELQEMAVRAGLRLRRVMGTYAGEAFTDDSPRWIGVFEKAW
ncbi:MAG: class I SAM-dependent methyltransferase [Geothrix sp.]|uniref:class I SAM-dependent methyltransferase n=1 Tax=Geothrix sp. TaxID=1962974 RepID=UPI0017AE5D97|nr:class I SAM-dependent methyltransferase [Geothrix sp.]NWJ42437.1 class I SAM-dependent methyltransferase [Geothrix sp.]WIL19599.1 MAG: class I SAM-dependent methyltransferase [Geothrix sp.]